MMMPPGFGTEHSRRNDDGGHGLAALRFPYGEVARMEAMVPGIRGEYYRRHGPSSQLENGDGRPRVMMAAGAMERPSPVRGASAEVWDMKAMATHRHRTLVAESAAQRISEMRAIPPHACPPGFRPTPMHSEPLPPQACPPGFRPPAIYTEAPPVQSCPPGFRPPIMYMENSAVMKPEMKFCDAETIVYRPEFRGDDRPGDPIGRRDTVRGSSMYGATDRRGWCVNESFSSGGRVCENRFVDPQIRNPFILPPQARAEQVPNQSYGGNLEHENCRRGEYQHVRPLSPSVPVSKDKPPLASSYPEVFRPGNLRDEKLASTREAGKRRSYECADNTRRTSPFKRPRADDVMDSPLRVRSRRDLEFESTWSDGLRMSGARSHERDGSHLSSLHTRKLMEYRSMTESGDGTVEHPRDRQESTTRHNSPYTLSQRGPLSPRGGNRPEHSKETESELRIRSSSFRPISHTGRSCLRPCPRPDRSNSKEKQRRNDPSVDLRSRCSSYGLWSPRLGLRSRSPDAHLHNARKSLRVDESSLRKDNRSPRLPTGKSIAVVEIDEHAAHWGSGNGSLRKAAQNESSTRKDKRSESGSQFLDFVSKHQSQSRSSTVVQKSTCSLDSTAPAPTDKIKNEKALSSPLTLSTKQKIPEMKVKAEQRGNLDTKLPLQKHNLQVSKEKASLSSAEHNAGGDQSVSIPPVSASSLKSMRNLNSLSVSVSTYHISQALELDWEILPEKVTPRRRRRMGDSGDSSVTKISGAAGGAPSSSKEPEADITKLSSAKSGPNQNEVQAGVLHKGTSSKLLLRSRTFLERESLATPEGSGQLSKTGITDVGIVNPFIDSSKVSSELKIHPPSVVHGTDTQLTIISEVVKCVTEKTGQKVIFTGHRSEHIPPTKLRKTATGTDLHSPKSLGKSQAPGGSLLQEDDQGRQCSEQTKEALPPKPVGKGRASPPMGIKRPSDNASVHRPESNASVLKSQLIVPDMATASESKVSPSGPSHLEASSGLTTLACGLACKSPSRATDEAFGYVVRGTRLYMQRKSNQLVVAPSAAPILRPGLEKCDVPQGYVKRTSNQLVRCSRQQESSGNGASQKEFGGGDDQMKTVNRQRRYSAQLNTKLGRVLSQKNGRVAGLARVWTLSNDGKHTTSGMGVSRDWRFSLLPWKRVNTAAPRLRYPLFPWKRVNTAAPLLRRGRPVHEGKTGALFFHISNQLQRYRSGHPVYTRSADGFSLHRSGVVSRSGANLKWTKSLMTQSILASEAATKVVAEAEKQKRDKKEAVVRAVAKARDERRAVQNAAKRAKLRSGSVDPSSVSSSEPVGIGGAVYVRKGFGNQLVRDSRTAARVFASEKVRWSLHNARLRKAKKQAFCVYYTRFGVCKRGDGKCLYIHDPEKVAVCTKFLRGCCSDPACCLTHKVIPERMPDCSYFLEGLCTNESCPYRHVNVNPKAPICEGFLQGYCADGDMCNKKHTYVCPEYTVTGKCSSSTCKLRHPKKISQAASASKESAGSKREGRYFAHAAPAEGEHQGQPVSTANTGGLKIFDSGDDRTDFISVDEVDIEPSKECQHTDMFLDHRGVLPLGRLPKGGSSNALEGLLKPRFLLRRDVSS